MGNNEWAMKVGVGGGGGVTGMGLRETEVSGSESG
jgi:hypothetical protein